MSGLRVLTDSRLLCCFDIFPNIDRIKGINVPLFVIHGEVCYYIEWHTRCYFILFFLSLLYLCFVSKNDLEVRFKHGTGLLEAGTLFSYMMFNEINHNYVSAVDNAKATSLTVAFRYFFFSSGGVSV